MLLLSEQLRRAITTSGLSRYEISKATGVSQSTLSKFVLRQRGISIEAMDSVGKLLGLAIVRSKKKQPTKRSKGG
jgi:transcriptional regulator with XRE-family HTH domain